MIDKKIEILSPSGSMEAVRAAVACGADAVYLGGKDLNARRNATNFDTQELLEVVEHCHAYGVKVHQTVNILVYDKEIPLAVEAIKTASRIGVDALIIQDLTVAKIAREIAPHIKRHASTQMAVHNLEGVRQAEALGFSRVVLARELTKKEIAYICENTTMETEVFLHGALCMCVSGQCYLSSMFGERSGNRGLCAQPCRLPFKVEGGSEYALSLKDLSLVDKIKEMADLGVTSVKIEGRMKRPEYVAAATKAAFDARNGEYVDFETLKDVFSRSGFTTGYYDNVMDKAMFGIRQKEDVISASGVFGELSALYRNSVARINAKMHIVIKSGQPVCLSCTDIEENTATVTGEIPQVAINKPTDLEKARQNLEKTGGTPFVLQELTGDIDEGLMVPASQLNLLRREVLERLIEMRCVNKYPQVLDYVPQVYPKGDRSKLPQIRVRLRDNTQLTPYILNTAQCIIMPLGRIKTYLTKNPDADPQKFYGEIAVIDFDTQKTADSIKELLEMGVTDFVAGNIGGIGICKELGVKNIHGGFNLNIFNTPSIEEYKDLGLCDTELSFELNINNIYNMGRPMPIGIVAYGYLPLMTFRNCPIKANRGCGGCTNGNSVLTDRKNIEFFIDCGDGKSRLFNSVPLYLADRMNELNGIDFITLYFTKENVRECEDMLKKYLGDAEGLNGITRGLYYRNVL